MSESSLASWNALRDLVPSSSRLAVIEPRPSLPLGSQRFSGLDDQIEAHHR